MQRRKLKGNRGVYKCHTFGTLQNNSEIERFIIDPCTPPISIAKKQPQAYRLTRRLSKAKSLYSS